MSELRPDKGASLFMVAIALLLLMGAAAIAIDLAAMRLDRSADQKVTDSAASAGALAAFAGTGQDACEAALDYVAVNAQEIGSIDTTGCASAFSSTCNAANPQSHTVAAGGRFSITVTYPVENGNALMTSGQLGAPSQPLVAEDGDPCERVGVEMSATHQSHFAQLIGFNEGTTTVHTVAAAFDPAVDGPPLNLLVLDRSNCDAILVQGGGGPGTLGGIVVDVVTDPDTGDQFPGVAAADSDASSGCTQGVLHATGNSVLRADGPPGCAGELPSGPGDGCGIVEALAPGTPGCNPPACVINGSNAVIAPEPIPLPERITRRQVDHEYNCWGNYTNPPAGLAWATSPLAAPDQDIPGCTEGTPAHIYDLIGFVGQNGPVGGFAEWNADLGLPCDIPSSNPGISITGNIRVDCDPFVVRGPVSISDGDIVFDGDVTVTAGPPGNPTRFSILNSPSTPGWAFFRDGVLDKGGRAHLTFDQTMVYFSRTSSITMAGNTVGTLTWVGPDTGDFDDLALWSDSAITHAWAGQALLTMEGVFFTPWATATYTGNGIQQQTDAQWVAHRLQVSGNGVLTITPKFEFPVKVDGTPRTILIR